ncbi:Reverse transcriptase domain-containing protein, partial [Aphis craccivora]
LLFELHSYKKIDFVKNWFCVKIPVFCYFFRLFPDTFENYWKFFTFDPPKYQLDSLSYQKQCSLFTAPKRGDRHKKKTHHCKINTFITSFRI